MAMTKMATRTSISVTPERRCVVAVRMVHIPEAYPSWVKK
jgi:hypothetical protein